MTTKQKGDFGETTARGYLQAKGYEIAATNYRRGGCEIDIIAKTGDVIAFVEVKYRKGLSKGEPYEAVTAGKRRRIIRAARFYIAENGLDAANFRFDVIEVFGTEYLEINHIEDAFDATE